MPRAGTYYDNRSNEMSAPVQQQPSATPYPATTQQELYKKIYQQQLQDDSEYWQKEGRRSFWGRLPYEFQNTLFDMPEEREWREDYNYLQKRWHEHKEGAKLVGRAIRGLPREMLKGSLKLEQSFYDLSVSMLAAGDETRESIMEKLGRDETYSLPWLGDVRGFAGSYQEGKELGLSPFFSAVKATGETAGDVVISYVGLRIGQAAFKPWISKVRGTHSIAGQDFRPLTKQQVGKIKIKVEGQVVKGTVSQPKQNPDVTYMRLPKSVAKDFKGNPNNTFLKVTPKGEGLAEYSIVQLRKSLVEATKDFFRQKFGRSAVTEGPFGPELKLHSGSIRYSPTALVKKGDAALARNSLDIGQSTVPIMSAAEKAAAGAAVSVPATVSEAYQFYSPNIKEAMTFEEAAKQLTSSDQASYKMIGQDIDKQLGLQSTAESAIGDWSDGAENTVFNEIANAKDFDEIRYSAALKGKIGNQKSVIPFLEKEGGADSLFITEVKGVSIEEIRSKLDDLGIQFRTLVKTKDGIKVVVFDQGTELITQVNKLGQTYDTTIEQIQGRGEFLGGETRVEGLAEFNKTISEYQVARPDSKLYQQPQASRVPNSVSEKAQAIDPFLTPKPELPTVMGKPLKGFENKMVTEKQINQILELRAAQEIADVTLQAVSKVITGKDNIYDLTQTEAYEVSEAIRLIPEEGTIPGDDWQFITRPWTHPARYWMEAAERELGFPVYSEVFLPIETGSRLLRVYSERWQDASREIFGKYSKPKFVEERRLITEYIEGNKNAILKNKAISPEVAKDLAKIGDWLQEQYKLLFKDLGITSERFFEVYSPKIRQIGGIHHLYKSGEMPVEIKPFYRFEREGALSPLEDDALALFDIYTRAIGKETFLKDPIEQAKIVIESSPETIKKGANDYLQEKLGFQEDTDRWLANFGKSLSEHTKGLVPENISKQMYDFLMTSSYAGALGFPRIMPVFRNSVQVLLTTYPELGPEFFAQGVKRFYGSGGLKEIRDKGFLVKMGVPYGADLVTDTGKGLIGKALDHYKRFNRAMMKPYAGIDVNNRGITYHGVKARFEYFWNDFLNNKISYADFEHGINMDGFSPTLQNVIRGKLQINSAEATEEALELMIMDILDRTQFPYRKGSESRLHYGTKGKLGLQFAQWSWEYFFTIKSWISRGQWDKLVEWMGMSTAIKRTTEDTFGFDVSKWVNAPEDFIMGIFGKGTIGASGPFSGFPLGPIAKMAFSAVAGINASFTGMTDDINKHWQDIYRSFQIYGGTLTGVGSQKLRNFYQSVKRFEAGMAPSPDPKKPFGVWSSTGKIIRWVDFTDLLRILMGFDTPEGYQQSERIDRIKKDSVEYSNHINDAMNALIDGNFEKFDKIMQKYNLMIPDLSTKLKSYQIPLDQRIFERMPVELKIKYFNAFYPTEGQ